MSESFATGTDLTGNGNLQQVWDDHIPLGAPTPISTMLGFEDLNKYNITRGWPIEGALVHFAFMADPVGDVILNGQWVAYDGTGKVELATAPVATAPIKFFVANNNSADKDVIAANFQLGLLSTHFRFETDQFTGLISAFLPGAPVTVTAGLADAVLGGKQIVATVISVDAIKGVIELEVN